MNRKVTMIEDLDKQLKEMLFTDSEALVSELVTTAMRRILQEALEEEVSDFLGRGRYEHRSGEERSGYRNGYQDKRIRIPEGVFNIRKPRVRDSEEAFRSQITERVTALEDKLKGLALESYVRGLSTRDIEKTFIDQNGKPLISKSGVSAMSETLYAEYEEFAARDLSGFDVVYLFIDGVYEAVKNYTNKQGILCAWAICSDGSKQLLHMAASNGESTENWNVFFRDMMNKGLRQPLLIVSDGAKGLIRAITESFPKAKRQRCIAHKLRNILAKVPREFQAEIKGRVKSVYYAPDMETAETLSTNFVRDYSDKFPSMIKCFSEDLSACLTHLEFPEGHRKHIRTTNLIERAFVEEKRRTKIMPQHAHEKGALGLVFSILIRASDSWRRVSMTPLDLELLKYIRNIICPENKEEELISYRIAA